MVAKSIGFSLVLALSLLISACNEQALPTPLPVAVLPTPLPATSTSLPATMDLTSIASEPAAATAVPTERIVDATATTAVTTAPTKAATGVGINITQPSAMADILMGSEIVARGLVQLDPDHTAWISLLALDGQLLAEAEAAVEDGFWESAISVPDSVSGIAFLTATVRDGDGALVTENELPVNLALDVESSDRYLALFRPREGDPAMGGFNLFFDGRAQRPVANTVTISVWSDDCRTQVARQSFVLRGSGYWQGFVIIPQSVSGPGCAIAHFGTPGEESWRSVQIPLLIADNEDSAAGGVTIGNPPPDSRVTGGKDLLLYGTALNASEEEVRVAVMLENGRILNESSVLADYWGYWELLVLIPGDVQGPAAITASVDGRFESRTVITIDPAPTPSP